MVLDKLREAFRPRQRLTPEQYLKKLTARGLHPDGTPIVSNVPLAPPIGYKKQPSMVEIVRDMVRGERLKQEAMAAGHETFEEAEDFEIGDEPELLRSPWENQFDPPIDEVLKAGREAIQARQKAPEPEPGGEGAKPPRKPPAPAAAVPEEP